jgi:hypothetical protein
MPLSGKFLFGICLSLFAFTWTTFNGLDPLSSIIFVTGILLLIRAQSDFDDI